MAQVILYERSGAWSQALRRDARRLGWQSLQIHNCRGLVQCLELLEDAPASLVALQLAAGNEEAVLETLAVIGREFPQARSVVLNERGSVHCDWLARELGAIAIIPSARDLRPVVRMALRHHNRLPTPDQTPEQRVRSQLPWSDAARE